MEKTQLRLCPRPERQVPRSQFHIVMILPVINRSTEIVYRYTNSERFAHVRVSLARRGAPPASQARRPPPPRQDRMRMASTLHVCTFVRRRTDLVNRKGGGWRYAVWSLAWGGSLCGGRLGLVRYGGLGRLVYSTLGFLRSCPSPPLAARRERPHLELAFARGEAARGGLDSRRARLRRGAHGRYGAARRCKHAGARDHLDSSYSTRMLRRMTYLN